MEDSSKACCFTGHRQVKSEHQPLLERVLLHAIRVLYKRGYRGFMAGGALGFDTAAAKAVLKAKEYLDDIKLILILPCQNQTKNWKQSDITVYKEIMEQADKVVYTSEQYTSGCMMIRYMNFRKDYKIYGVEKIDSVVIIDMNQQLEPTAPLSQAYPVQPTRQTAKEVVEPVRAVQSSTQPQIDKQPDKKANKPSNYASLVPTTQHTEPKPKKIIFVKINQESPLLKNQQIFFKTLGGTKYQLKKRWQAILDGVAKNINERL